MSKLWKALGAAALAAAVIPCKVEKDEETGVKTYRSLLSKLKVGPGENGEGTDIRLDLLGGVIPSALGRTEEDDYADDELEDMVAEPVFEMKLERHVPAAEETPAAGETQAVEDEVQAVAGETQAVADEVQAAAGETQAAADEVQAAAGEDQAVAGEAQAEAEKHGVEL